ncbi:hypothetical protein C8J56DRAFT_815573 [Mycena floridula]|nr:hypothetical protein C8J56DRAFT_815573 [Mycena floridula]
MVKITHFSAAIASLLSLTVVSGLEITNPGGPDLWWVAQSINTLAWTCNDPQAKPQYTIVLANPDPKILTAPQAIIAIENNFDCSKTITADQIGTFVGPNFTVQLANILNQTDVYAESQPFEIKPVGALYPTSTPAVQTATGTVASAAASSTSADTSKNGASSLVQSSSIGLTAVGAAILGLVL